KSLLRPARRQRQKASHRLALVHAALFRPDLDVSAAQQRIEPGHIKRRRVQRAERQRAAGRRRLATPATTRTAQRVVVLARLPRHEAVANLIGIARGIAGRLERLAAEQARRLVVKSTRRAGGKHPQYDVGPRHADEPDVVADNLVPAPLLERLFDAEGVAE